MNPIKTPAVRYAALAGLLYGLVCRIIFHWGSGKSSLAIMSIGFLFVVPAAVGFISAFIAAKGGGRGINVWIGLPVVSTLALLLSSFLLFWEGIICLVMLMPIALAIAIAGGAAGYFCGRRFTSKPLLCVAVLPFLVAPAEQWIGPTKEICEVPTQIEIEASPAVVWKHIERVATIQPEEQRYSWTQSIGFPRPLEATLTGEGIGAVRHATFAGGVLFIETVTDWQPERRLTFTIRADTANIPPHTLDEHVTIGGPYFDTLEGDYRIEPLPNGKTRLHLSSRHRVSTTFNFYAGFWTSAIMRDIQDNILHVIRSRCERTKTR